MLDVRPIYRMRMGQTCDVCNKIGKPPAPGAHRLWAMSVVANHEFLVFVSEPLIVGYLHNYPLIGNSSVAHLSGLPAVS